MKKFLFILFFLSIPFLAWGQYIIPFGGTVDSTKLPLSGGTITGDLTVTGITTATTLAKFSFLSNGYIPYYSSTAGITNSAMYQLNGNVGIGTTNPLSKLVVQTDNVYGAKVMTEDAGVIEAAAASDIRFSTTPDGAGFINSKILGAREIGDNYASYLAFFTESKASGTTDASTEKMRIDRLGNVGIGTTVIPGSPKLGVQGTIGTYGLATDASNYQMGTLSASNGNGTLGSTTLSCVRAGTGAVNCDINLTPLGTGSVVINAGANILYRCVGGTGDGLISVNNANASCPVGTWTATSLKIN
jgi:hypothetical protein